MSTPTILLVHPGASFSTADVFTGLAAGLRANGARVVEFRLDVNLTFYQKTIETAILHDVLSDAVDPYKLSARGLGDMAIHFEVDAVIAVSGGNLHPIAPITLRELAGQRQRPFKTAVYLTESPYQGEQEVQIGAHYDTVFVNERSALGMFRLNRPEDVHYLPHAYNPEVHRPGPAEDDLRSDVFFVGTGFDERRTLFEAVDWGDATFVCKGYGWHGWETQDTLRPMDVLANEDAVRHYWSTQICLNHHRTTTTFRSGQHIAPGTAESIGPRAYEIAACGAFQLCDDNRPELADVFGESVPTYQAGDSEDLQWQIHYWLNRPALCEAYAAFARQAVQEHSWTNRAKRVLEILL